METTIQLSKETKEKISTFGLKGESYDEILKRIYALAVKEQLRDFLMSDEGLKNDILKKFKEESKIIFRQMYSLENNPHKGKLLGSVGGIIIKEIKYNNFRFYFITDGHKLKIMDQSKLTELLFTMFRLFYFASLNTTSIFSTIALDFSRSSASNTLFTSV